MTDTDGSSGYWTIQEIDILEDIIMNKDKLVTGVLVTALIGCAVKMVKELKEHGAAEEVVGEKMVIEE